MGKQPFNSSLFASGWSLIRSNLTARNMKPPKKRLAYPPIGITTAHGEPSGTAHLNQDRLRVLEEARIAHLPEYIAHLEKRLNSLAKQKEKTEKLLAEARKEWEGVAKIRKRCYFDMS